MPQETTPAAVMPLFALLFSQETELSVVYSLGDAMILSTFRRKVV